MREDESDVIEVRLDPLRDSLQVLRNQMPLTFTEQTWMDLKGEIYSQKLNEAIYITTNTLETSYGLTHMQTTCFIKINESTLHTHLCNRC